MLIKVTLNGEDRELERPGTVAGLLATYDLNPKMVVVERNGEIISRSQYDEEPVEAGDSLEIVQMMAGG